MADQGGGRLWRSLGPVGTSSATYSGEIGERTGSATLRLTFSLAVPGTVFVRLLAVAPFTDRYVAAALQGAGGRTIILGDDGRALGVDVANTGPDESQQRLPAGDYTVVISTSQWQEIPFSLQLQVFALERPRLAPQSRGRLRAKLSTLRPEVFLRGRGGLRASLQPTETLVARASGTGQLRMGLQVIPSYQQPALAGLGHAWFIRLRGNTSLLRVGGATGLSWATVDLPETPPTYLATRLSLPDFRANPGRRVIFSDRAYDIYGAYPELGLAQAVLLGQQSPDTPGVPFLRLTNGRYHREVLLGLPIEGERLIVLHLDEVLLWNNDVIRDLEPATSQLSARNLYRASAHQRRITAFVTDGALVRRLQNPPGELLRRLDAALPPLIDNLVEAGVRVPGPSFALPSLRLLYPDFIAEQRLPGPGDAVFGADPSQDSAGLLLSYGMTRLLAADRTMSSAALFSTLENFPAIAAAAGYDPLATGFVVSQLPDLPDGLPVLSPWYRDGAYALDGEASTAYQATSPQLLRYARWGGPLPGRASTAVSPADPRWTLAAQGLVMPELRLFRSESPELLLAYDWGDGPYCRGQLQELGFGDEDLSTAAPVQPQSGSLNAGGPRPLRGRGGLALGALVAIKVRYLRSPMRGNGRLLADLAWGPRGRVKGFGRLRASLSVKPDLRIVRRLLRCRLTGSGSLSASRFNRPPANLRGRGGLGRPWLSSKPPNEYPLVDVAGGGGLSGTLSAT